MSLDPAQIASARVSIGGAHVISSATWALTTGTDPYVTSFNVLTEDADRLLDGPLRPVDLEIDAGEHGTATFKNLYVLQAAASPNPYHRRIVVADRRWFWRHAQVEGRFNIRRRIGTGRVGAPNIPELQPVVDTFAYAPWSTPDGSGRAAARWSARAILNRVLDTAFQPERDLGNAAPTVSFRAWPGLDEIPIENLELAAAGPDAIRRVLGYIPEAEISLDSVGNVIIFNRASGGESGLTESILEAMNRGHIEKIDLRRVRPRQVHVYFRRECELRLDTLASGETSTQDDRVMTNVLPIPDFSLEVDGETLTQGTWITFEQAFTAWGAMPGIGVALSDEICRQAFIPGIGLWEALRLHGTKDPDAEWMGRVAAVEQHWRQTYRINRRWMDRIAEIRAERVALLDPTTGQRAPAQAFSNYCVISTNRTLYLARRDGITGGDMPYAMNVVGYPKGGLIGPETRAAPFQVSVLDSDQGVIRFDHIIDPLRMRDVVLPSMMETFGDGTGVASSPTNPGPSANIVDQNRVPIAFNALTSSMKAPALTASHKVATIITALQGSPNGKTQLTRIIINPEQVAGLVPPAVAEQLTRCDGPVHEVIISPSVETARVAWYDSTGVLTERAFGIGVDAQDADEYVDLSAITVNQGSDTSGASLTNIALAQAASVYAALGDRVQGNADAAFSPNLRPTGFLVAVEHKVASNGAVSTSVDLPEQVAPLDLAAYLDSGTYAIVKRMVGAGGRK